MQRRSYFDGHPLRSEHDAYVVQDAHLRVFRDFDGYRGGDMRDWLPLTMQGGCSS